MQIGEIDFTQNLSVWKILKYLHPELLSVEFLDFFYVFQVCICKKWASQLIWNIWKNIVWILAPLKKKWILISMPVLRFLEWLPFYKEFTSDLYMAKQGKDSMEIPEISCLSNFTWNEV